MNRLLVPERKTGRVRHGQADVECQPRLADLRLAREDGGALGDQPGANDAQRLRLPRMKRRRRDQSFVPCITRKLIIGIRVLVAALFFPANLSQDAIYNLLRSLTHFRLPIGSRRLGPRTSNLSPWGVRLVC